MIENAFGKTVGIAAAQVNAVTLIGRDVLPAVAHQEGTLLRDGSLSGGSGGRLSGRLLRLAGTGRKSQSQQEAKHKCDQFFHC